MRLCSRCSGNRDAAILGLGGPNLSADAGETRPDIFPVLRVEDVVTSGQWKAKQLLPLVLEAAVPPGVNQQLDDLARLLLLSLLTCVPLFPPHLL